MFFVDALTDLFENDSIPLDCLAASSLGYCCYTCATRVPFPGRLPGSSQISDGLAFWPEIMVVLGPCCSVVGCALRPGTNLLLEIKVYRFPKETKQRDAWIAALGRDNWTGNSRVCNTHFVTAKLKNHNTANNVKT